MIGAVQFYSLYVVYMLQKFCTSLNSERLELIRVVGTDRRSALMIRAKVNSKSELVEDREGNPRCVVVICCCDGRLLLRAVTCGHTV